MVFFKKIIFFVFLFLTLLFPKNRHFGPVVDIELSYNQEYYISAGEDGKIYFCNTQSHEVLNTFNLETNLISNVSLSYNNKFLAVSFNNNSIKIFNLENNSSETIYLENNFKIKLLKFIERGQLLCSTEDGNVFLWEIDSTANSLELVNNFKSSKSKIINTKVNSNKRNILSQLKNNQFARWDIGQTKQIEFIEGGNSYSSNFRIHGGDQTSYTENESKLDLVFTEETKIISPPSRNFFFDIPYKYYDFDISTDGSKIAIATDNNTIIVWNSNFSDSNLFLDGHDKKIIDFEFSNDGKKLATSSLDQSIKIWDTSNGRLLNSISIAQDWGTKIIFSNDVLIYGTYTGDVNFHILSNNNY